MGASTPWQAIAAVFYGPMAFVGGSGVTAIGVLRHLTVAGSLGAVLGMLALNVESAGKLGGLGILYATGVWALMTYVFLPNFDATMAARIPTFFTMWIFLHWFYGGFTGLFIPSLRPRLPAVQIERATTTVREAA
jgi:hypothetical protein